MDTYRPLFAAHRTDALAISTDLLGQGGGRGSCRQIRHQGGSRKSQPGLLQPNHHRRRDDVRPAGRQPHLCQPSVGQDRLHGCYTGQNFRLVCANFRSACQPLPPDSQKPSQLPVCTRLVGFQGHHPAQASRPAHRKSHHPPRRHRLQPARRGSPKRRLLAPAH